MAIIAQQTLFSWEIVDAASDLDRLKLVLSVLPDESLMRSLEKKRDKGRDDYPVRAVWNSMIAGIVFQHPTIESLRRELMRNGELRQVCGSDPCTGADAVPSSSAYTRFFRKLSASQLLIQKMFDDLVTRLGKLLPDFGSLLAGDSKALTSAGKPTKETDPDGRRDLDATWGKKEYHGRHKDGTPWTKIVTWFGYKVHLLVDATYELPIAWQVTTAKVSDTTEILPLLNKTAKRHEEILQRSKYLSLDKGYDSEKNNCNIFDNHSVKPLIDIRRDWKSGETTKVVPTMDNDRIVYDEQGTIFCVHPANHDCRKTEVTPMVYDGFEADRGKKGAVKYRCPAAVYDLACPERDRCGRSPHGRVVRIPLELDRRHFVPLPRSTQKWARLYATRTAVERVNSRIANGYVFDHQCIRGLNKMKVRMGLAMVIMLAFAVGAITRGNPAQMRQLVGRLPAIRAA